MCVSAAPQLSRFVRGPGGCGVFLCSGGCAADGGSVMEASVADERGLLRNCFRKGLCETWRTFPFPLRNSRNAVFPSFFMKSCAFPSSYKKTGDFVIPASSVSFGKRHASARFLASFFRKGGGGVARATDKCGVHLFEAPSLLGERLLRFKAWRVAAMSGQAGLIKTVLFFHAAGVQTLRRLRQGTARRLLIP